MGEEGGKRVGSCQPPFLRFVFTNEAVSVTPIKASYYTCNIPEKSWLKTAVTAVTAVTAEQEHAWMLLAFRKQRQEELCPAWTTE